MHFARPFLSLTKISLALLISSSSIAAEWDISGGISAGANYSDNSKLSVSNEDSKVVGTLTPSIRLNGKGARGKLNLRSSTQFDTLGDKGNDFNPQLNFTADTEVIKEFFYIDANASARQTTINSFEAFDNTSLNEQENITTTYQYSVSPFISSRLKDYANYDLRYRHDQQANQGNELDDSKQNIATLRVQSGKFFNVIGWSIFGSYAETDFEDQIGQISTSQESDNKFSSLRFDLAYRLNRKWFFTAGAGDESNDFISVDEDIDGKSWNTGIMWTPNSRTELKLDYGERYFGENPSVSFKHRHKRSTIDITYSKSITDSRNIRQSGNVLPDTDAFGQLAQVIPLDILQLLFGSTTTRTNSTILNEQFDFNYSLQGKRTNVNLTASDSRQTIQETGDEDIYRRISVNASRKLVKNISLNAGYTFDHRERGSDGIQIDTDFYTLGLTRQLSNRCSLSLNYTYSDRSSDTANDDFNQNRLSLLISIGF